MSPDVLVHPHRELCFLDLFAQFDEWYDDWLGSSNRPEVLLTADNSFLGILQDNFCLRILNFFPNSSSRECWRVLDPAGNEEVTLEQKLPNWKYWQHTYLVCNFFLARCAFYKSFVPQWNFCNTPTQCQTSSKLCQFETTTDRLTHSLTEVKCRATSVAKN